MQNKIIETIEVQNSLGEGILWRDSDNTIWWTDILSSKLFCIAWPSLKLKEYDTPSPVCSFSFIEGRDDVFLVAFDIGTAIYNPESQSVKWLDKPSELGGLIRMNDGRTDPAGRFWVGSLDDRERAEGELPNANLYAVDEVGNCASALQNVHISNGLCWSPDGCVVYFADSPTFKVKKAAFDLQTGKMGEFQDFHKFDGVHPDGAITDAEGNYLSALWGGSRVAVLSPDGECIGNIQMPVSQPTCVALGGSDKDLMFVTSAAVCIDTDEAGKPVEKQAGHMFILETDHKAWPQARAKVSSELR